jgi:Rrf2 family protein
MLGKHPGELTSTKEICDKHDLPFNVATKVMQLLTHHKILSSTHGVAGGYQISKDLSKINFYELIETVEGPVGIARCLSKVECSISPHCNIVLPVAYLNAKLIDMYKRMAILDMISVKSIREFQREERKYHGS